MTNQTSFTAAEWRLLGDAPLAASAAVALAEPGSGGAREADAVIAGWREAGALYGDSELVELIARYLDPEQREQQEGSEESAAAQAPDFVALLDEALGLCRRAVGLLEHKATPAETEGYKQFVLHIVRQVAEAASEGGLLGLGAERVSMPERRVILALTEALRA